MSFEKVIIGNATLYRGDCMEVLPTLTLGEIKTRIAPLSIDANGMESLGFTAKKERGACLYRESQWEAMKAAMLKSLAASGPARKAA